MDNYTIAPVLAADLPTVAHFIFSSQLTQPTNQFLFSDWPNESAQVSLYLSGLEKTIDRPSIEMLKAVDNSTGEMVASLILERKTPEIEDEEASTEPEKPISAPLGLNAEFYEFMKRALAGVQENMAQVDHFALTSIFVKSSCRNRGLGTQLVQLCQNRASCSGLPLFLCSIPSARGFYLKLGFKDTVHAEVDLSKWGPPYGGYGLYRLCGMLAVV